MTMIITIWEATVTASVVYQSPPEEWVVIEDTMETLFGP